MKDSHGVGGGQGRDEREGGEMVEAFVFVLKVALVAYAVIGFWNSTGIRI